MVKSTLALQKFSDNADNIINGTDICNKQTIKNIIDVAWESDDYSKEEFLHFHNKFNQLSNFVGKNPDKCDFSEMDEYTIIEEALQEKYSELCDTMKPMDLETANYLEAKLFINYDNLFYELYKLNEEFGYNDYCYSCESKNVCYNQIEDSYNEYDQDHNFDYC